MKEQIYYQIDLTEEEISLFSEFLEQREYAKGKVSGMNPNMIRRRVVNGKTITRTAPGKGKSTKQVRNSIYRGKSSSDHKRVDREISRTIDFTDYEGNQIFNQKELGPNTKQSFKVFPKNSLFEGDQPSKSIRHSSKSGIIHDYNSKAVEWEPGSRTNNLASFNEEVPFSREKSKHNINSRINRKKAISDYYDKRPDLTHPTKDHLGNISNYPTEYNK